MTEEILEKLELFLAEAVLAGPGTLTLWGHDTCTFGCVWTESLGGWYGRDGFVPSPPPTAVRCITCYGDDWGSANPIRRRTAQEIIDIAREQLRASE